MKYVIKQETKMRLAPKNWKLKKHLNFFKNLINHFRLNAAWKKNIFFNVSLSLIILKFRQQFLTHRSWSAWILEFDFSIFLGFGRLKLSAAELKSSDKPPAALI